MSYSKLLDPIIERLGANYIKGTDDIIQEIIEDMTSVASDASNRKETDEKLYPYIKKATISEYLTRGAEGLLSLNEGGKSSTFNDIEKKLRIDVAQIRRLP